MRIYLLKAWLFAEMEAKVFAQLAGGEERVFSPVKEAVLVAQNALALAQGASDAALEVRSWRLCAVLCRRLGDFAAAAAAFNASIVVLRATLASGWSADAAHDLLDSLVRVVSMEVMLGHFDLAQERLDEAVKLTQEINARGHQSAFLEAETIHWLKALIARARGYFISDLIFALSEATSAADAYIAAGPSPSQVRVLWLVTEIALDVAGATSPSQRKVFLDVAQRYHGLTKAAAKQAKDKAGDEMATLSEARYRQLLDPKTKISVNQPRNVLHRTIEQRPDDWPLQVDASVTLGRTLRERGEIDEARAAFEEALRIANEHNAPGAAWCAERALASVDLRPFSAADVA